MRYRDVARSCAFSALDHPLGLLRTQWDTTFDVFSCLILSRKFNRKFYPEEYRSLVEKIIQDNTDFLTRKYRFFIEKIPIKT